jgi:phosphoserine phosphatase
MAAYLGNLLLRHLHTPWTRDVCVSGILRLGNHEEAAMKAFDFDNTIYRGESSIDLAVYMIRNNRKIILYLPMIFTNLVKYKLCMIGRKEMETILNDFCQAVMEDKDDIPGIIERFWQTHAHKVNKGILKLIGPEDIIITAGPDILINGIRDSLHTDHIISSEVDLNSGRFTYLNFKDNKVRRYKELYGDTPIDVFYTDSYNDRALMEISNQVFLVKKGVPLKQIKPAPKRNFQRQFCRKQNC